jgi:hypothetical protein
MEECILHPIRVEIINGLQTHVVGSKLSRLM